MNSLFAYFRVVKRERWLQNVTCLHAFLSSSIFKRHIHFEVLYTTTAGQMLQALFFCTVFFVWLFDIIIFSSFLIAVIIIFNHYYTSFHVKHFELPLCMNVLHK